MDEQNEINGAQEATSERPAPKHQAPAPTQPQAQAPYVRQRPAHRSVGTVSDFDSSGEEYPAQVAHDSDFTNRGPLVGGNSYKRSRSDAEKLRRDLHYGQYLEIPKGRRDIFVKRERRTNVKTFLALVLVVVVLAVAVYFLWQYMQTNWGAAGIR